MPYRVEGLNIGAPVRILLITSRESGRWVIPKGNPVGGLTSHTAAAVEARDEAGVVGLVCPTALGSYRYRKRRGNGAHLMADVEVFPLAVTSELARWKEQDQRERRWMSLSEAADLVHEPDLAALIRDFDATPLED